MIEMLNKVIDELFGPFLKKPARKGGSPLLFEH